MASMPLPGAPGISPLVAPLMQPSVSSLGGLPGSGLSAAPGTLSMVDTMGVPSECLLLKNMFDPSLEVCSIIIKGSIEMLLSFC